ncbi:MAG: YicC family protein [Oscillospiraceae bacterium]|nr:YicC family protein [Candidatus Equicaccousia limihippi]
MVRSMTGYGRSVGTFDGLTVTVEIKSVNHRCFEYNCRVPRAYLFLEERLKPTVQSAISRGKIDVFVNVVSGEESGTKITLNKAYAKEYFAALSQLKDNFDIVDDISVSLMAKNSEIFTVDRQEVDQEDFTAEVSKIAQEAITAFNKMRTDEGERLATDIKAKLEQLSALVEKVEEQSPVTLENYRKRLYGKISEILEDRTVDENRLLTEVALFADKIAVDEETVRLKSHITGFYNFLDGGTTEGKKIDFLIQEMNRETNTIGSKAQDSEIASTVVEMKWIIEKIREQIQNIE